MSDVLAGKDDADRETAALGPSRGEELAWFNNLCDGEPVRHLPVFFRGKVDGVVYTQSYLEPTEENLRLFLDEIEKAGLTLNSGLEEQLAEIKRVLSSGNREAIEALIDSIQQLRLFDARYKDISREPQSFHPITLDIKFKAVGEDAMNRPTLKWRANENGDEAMIAATDAIATAYEAKTGKALGRVKRYIIAYEWLPYQLLDVLKAELKIRQIGGDLAFKVCDLLAEEFAVKLDVRYDVVVTPDGKEVRIVTREAEVNGPDDEKVNWQLDRLCAALEADGYTTFVPDTLNYGELALAADPGALVDGVLAAKGVEVDAVRQRMNDQVNRIVEALGDDQIVVDLPEKAKVLGRLTSAGDWEKVKSAVRDLLELPQV